MIADEYSEQISIMSFAGGGQNQAVESDETNKNKALWTTRAKVPQAKVKRKRSTDLNPTLFPFSP